MRRKELEMEKTQAGIKVFLRRSAAFIITVALLLSLGSVYIFANDRSALAEDFVSAVEAIAQHEGGQPWENAVWNAVDCWDAYEAAGGSSEDAAVADAYAEYAVEKATLDACITFINAVNDLSAGGLTYAEKSMLLDGSLLIYTAYKDNRKFNNYDGIGTAQAKFITEYEEFDIARGFSEAFVNYAKEAAAATTYGEADRLVKLALENKARMSIPDYPGLAEAEADILTARAFMSERLLAAIPFIDAATAVPEAQNKLEKIIEALGAYVGIDTTVEGVADAKETLDSEIEDYNSSATEANDSTKSAFELALGILF